MKSFFRLLFNRCPVCNKKLTTYYEKEISRKCFECLYLEED
jgi:uncharacterized protein with PIN domain